MVFWGDFSHKVMFEHRPEGSEGESHMDIWEKKISRKQKRIKDLMQMGVWDI